MKLISRVIPFLLLILLFGATLPTHAQDSNVSVDFGLGTATDSSNGNCINTFGEEGCFNTPRMTGLFGTFGADFMLNRHIGVGGEYSFRVRQGPYGDVNYRPAFYDFNVLYHPLGGGETTRVVPEIQAGLGGAQLKFYAPPGCDALVGCSSAGANNFLESSNHFQAHLAAGLKLYVKGGLFVRPQVDVHWVNNFFQFGGAWVPQYTVAIGYTLGSH